MRPRTVTVTVTASILVIAALALFGSCVSYAGDVTTADLAVADRVTIPAKACAKAGAFRIVLTLEGGEKSATVEFWKGREVGGVFIRDSRQSVAIRNEATREVAGKIVVGVPRYDLIEDRIQIDGQPVTTARIAALIFEAMKAQATAVKEVTK